VGKFTPATLPEAPPPPVKPETPPSQPKTRKPYKPAPDHPWRRYPVSQKAT
jgi:hypothetical protein